MNRYETFIVFESDIAEEERKTVLDRVESLITGNKGTVLVFDDWGSRKLAYPIRKKNQGYYVRVDYCDAGNMIDPMEVILSQDTRVLRFMTIRLEVDVDAEALKAEITKPEEEPVAAEPEVGATTESEPVTADETDTDTVEKE